MIDLTHILDVITTALLAIAGFIAKTFHTRLQGAEQKLSDLHTIYVKRDDFKEVAERMFAMLERIDNKLDNKADK